MKIVLPEYLDNISDDHRQQLQQLGDVTFYDDIPKDEDELIKRLQGAEITALKWINMTEHGLDVLPNLKALIVLSAGYGHLPFTSLKKNKVIGINCPTHNAPAVAEHTIALLLAQAKQLLEAQTMLRDGLWKDSPSAFLGTEIAGKTLCVIGKGNIGSKVVEKAKALGMIVHSVTSNTSAKQCNELLHHSEYVSLNLPYSEATHHLFDKAKLLQMKKGSVLINTSRGAIVDQKALLEVLQSGHLGGAALDVFENEPVFSRDLPKEIKQLAALPQVIASPHTAYNTKEAAFRLGEELIANIKGITTGKPINVVA